MPVRNLMRIKPKIWIPPIFTTIYKLEVVRSDGTIDDVTDIIWFAMIQDGTNEAIGNFEILIPNPNETFTGVWQENDFINYFKDYATSATTKRFRGRIDKISYRNNNIQLTGRREDKFMQDITVTKQFVDQELGSIIVELFTTYGEGRFTTTNVDLSTGITLTTNWHQVPFMDAIREIIDATQGSGAYNYHVDALLDVHFALAGSVKNTTDAIIHEHNLIEVSDFATDAQFIKNRIIVYGARVNGNQILFTAEDTSIQGKGVKEEIVNDDNVTTLAQAKELAQRILDDKKRDPQIGDVKGFLLATIQPGETIRLSSPENNIPPLSAGYQQITYKDIIDIRGGELSTTITVNREPKKIAHVFKDRIVTEAKRKDASINPNEMRFSFPFDFTSDSGTHNNTEIVDGVLKLQSGKTSGNWTSPQESSIGVINEGQLLSLGQSLTGAAFEVSADGGVNFQTESPSTTDSFTFANTGVNLRIKVSITDTNTQIDSLNVLYK